MIVIHNFDFVKKNIKRQITKDKHTHWIQGVPLFSGDFEVKSQKFDETSVPGSQNGF